MPSVILSQAEAYAKVRVRLVIVCQSLYVCMQEALKDSDSEDDDL